MCSAAKEELSLVVVIPAFNEEGAIGTVVRAIHSQPMVGRVIVVDNGSTDGTTKVATEAGAIVVSELRRGYGSACLAGMREIADENLVCFLDGDGSDYPEDLQGLLQPLLEDKADLVVGSRSLSGNSDVLPPHQRFGNFLVALLLGLPFGVRLSDLGPFRVIKREVLDSLNMESAGYGWTIEMELKVLQQGHRLCEVPVRYRKRIAGKSKISGTLKGSVFAATVILSVLCKGYIQGLRGGKSGNN